jgi:hypothetical protein
MVNGPILESFLDESADEQQEAAFCVGAFLCAKDILKVIQNAWVSRLQAENVAYFRASDCKAARGPFGGLRKTNGSLDLAKQAAFKIRTDLESILLSSHWIGFGLCVDLPEYANAWSALPEARLFFSEDPTVAAYSSMIQTITEAVVKQPGNHAVKFVVDDSTYSEKISDAYEAVKTYQPELAQSMATLIPLDDKVTPPLQMADLIASILKDSFIAFKETGAPFPARWDSHIEPIGIWDGEHTLDSIITTIDSDLFLTGQLVLQPGPKPKKRDVKMWRRLLIKRATSQDPKA